ncbi:MAG: hypothetical protein IH627_22290 [Rubrivivax sp.]|nr:hypothetical protein [Rubrivivax sp.]
MLDTGVQAALAVQHHGTFVTLDRSTVPASVPGARKEHLTVLGVAP